MANTIIKYEDFLFEADGVNTQIQQTKIEISKVQDEIQFAKDEKVKKVLVMTKLVWNQLNPILLI